MIASENLTRMIDIIGSIDGLQVSTEIPLKDFTTIGIGGRCLAMVEVSDAGALKECLEIMHRECRPSVDFFMLGGGSNLLVSDRGYDGVVLRLGGGFRELIDMGGRLTVGAAYPLKDLSLNAIKEGWGGMEYFAGLPGTVGGAVRMNAGAWGREIWDFIQCVYCVETKGTERIVSREDVSPGYRKSGLEEGLIVTKIEIAYQKDKSVDMKAKALQFMTRRKKGQAIGYPSFGSVFRNPEGLHAGKLIDSLGLKGSREGNAMISDKHGNFIVNLGDAMAVDVLSLMRVMKRGVRDEYGIELEPEVVFLGMSHEELEGIV
jgi:UDP-N-acetylmuramate dehydrogenase